MINNSLSETIAAISTPIGDSGIGIVRLSGKESLCIADKIFVSKNKKLPSRFKSYTVHYGWIVEGGRVIDEVILTVMRSPGSFTKEDIVEINCHGGIVAIRAVLDLVLKNGARAAEPGEFTKRAFLNGRIDLAQAEAVMDLIKAKTDAALNLGLLQLSGMLSSKINSIGNDLLDVLAAIEANIDFPEDQTGEPDILNCRKKLHGVCDELNDLLGNSRFGRIMRDGINCVICGRPNVGKSSLLNAVLKQERSIVTPIAGTTRDVIEEIIDIKGIPVKIVDTAGILEPRDLIEKKAVSRSRKYMESADLVIMVFDGSKPVSKEDLLLIKKVGKKEAIAVINKIDLKQRIDKNALLNKFSKVIGICAKKAQNIGQLEDAIVSLVFKGRLKSPESLIVSSLRHIEALRKIQKIVAEAAGSLDNKIPPEFIAQNIKDALAYIDELLWKKFSDGLLDKIFSEFCIGK